MLIYCRCKNIKIEWSIRDFSLVPRACQCNFCLSKNAQWLSKSGSRFELSINYRQHYRLTQQGTNTAYFHQCTHCGEFTAATAIIGKQRYGAINANCLNAPHRFADAKRVTPSSLDSALSRQNIWQQNWCSPVTIQLPKPALKIVK